MCERKALIICLASRVYISKTSSQPSGRNRKCHQLSKSPDLEAPPTFCRHVESPLEATEAPLKAWPPPPQQAAPKNRRAPEEKKLVEYLHFVATQCKSRWWLPPFWRGRSDMESSFVFVTTFVASDSFQGISYISIGHSRPLRAGNIIFAGGDTVLCSVRAVQG